MDERDRAGIEALNHMLDGVFSAPQSGADICEYDGHEWGDAGGGLLICLRCEAEKWEGERDPR